MVSITKGKLQQDLENLLLVLRGTMSQLFQWSSAFEQKQADHEQRSYEEIIQHMVLYERKYDQSAYGFMIKHGITRK